MVQRSGSPACAAAHDRYCSGSPAAGVEPDLQAAHPGIDFEHQRVEARGEIAGIAVGARDLHEPPALVFIEEPRDAVIFHPPGDETVDAAHAMQRSAPRH